MNLNNLISSISCSSNNENNKAFRLNIKLKQKLVNISYDYLPFFFEINDTFKENVFYYICFVHHPQYYMDYTLLDIDYFYSLSFWLFLKPMCQIEEFYIEIIKFDCYDTNLSLTMRNLFTNKNWINDSVFEINKIFKYSLPLLDKMVIDETFPNKNIMGIDHLCKSSTMANGYDICLESKENLIIEACGIMNIFIKLSNNMMEYFGGDYPIILRSSFSRRGIKIYSLKILNNNVIDITLTNNSNVAIIIEPNEYFLQFIPIHELQIILNNFSITRDKTNIKIGELQQFYKIIFGVPVFLNIKKREKKEFDI